MSRFSRYLSLFIITVVLVSGLFTGTALGGHESPEQHVEYSITHNETTGESRVTVEFTVTDSEKYDIWNGNWNVPRDAEIVEASSDHSDSVEVTRNESYIFKSE